MKKQLLFSSALLAAMAASAQTWVASTVGEGDFYLYNVGAAQFAQGGNAWGTQISLHQGGQLVTLEANGEGYNIDSHISNGGANHYFGGGEYLDGGASAYTFEALEGGAYAIKAAGGAYMYAEAGNSLVKHSATADRTSPYAQWKLLSVKDLKADMTNASLANPVDVTPLIFCAGFGRNNTYKDKWNGSPAIGGDNTNMCAEKWNTNFDVNQVLTDMPAGKYELRVQGFYRAGNPGDLNDETASVLNAILYANTIEQPLVSIQSEANNPNVVGNSYNAGTMPNSMAQASNCFTNGLYENVMKFKLAEAADLTIGVKKVELIGNDWSIFDNFRLVYLGVPDFSAVTALVEQAEAINGKHDVELDEALGTAIAYAKQVVEEKDEDNMDKAIEDLQAEMDKVNASIAQYEAAKAAIDAAKAKAAAFDEAGQAAFNELIAWCEQDYNNGELNFNAAGGNDIYTQIQDALAAGAKAQSSRGADMTSLIVNADFETGNLNGWTAVNAQWQNNNTYGTINRFAEKWVAAPGTLADCSLTQTVSLGMGVYVLEADVIATQQGGVPEGGIVGMSLVAGSESVACSTGNGETTHYTLEFTAPYTQNSVELGFKVEGTNGNWWAIDNFKLTLKHVILPEPELSELYFEEYDAMDNGICTYAKDMGTNGTTYAQMQPITSEGQATAWEIVENGDARAAGVFAYGSEAWLGAKGYLAPAEGYVEGSTHALGLNPVWSGAIQYTRPYALDKGYYKVKTAVYNAANGTDGGTDVAANKIGYITEDGTEYFMATKKFTKGAWTEDEVLVKIDEYCIGKLSAGVTANNAGTASCVHLFLDYITVEPISAAEFYAVEMPAAIAAAEAAKEGIAAVEGEGLFMNAVGSTAALDEAVATAKALTDESTAEEYEAALEALEAVLTPAINKPNAAALYAIKNAGANVYMNITDGVKVEETPSNFSLIEAENGWILKSGENYVGMEGAKSWNLNNTDADAWTITYVGNGKYTLKGKDGFIGADKLEAGSSCYDNKGTAAADNSEWIIELATPAVVTLYNEDNSKWTANVQPLNEENTLMYTIEAGEETPEYQNVEGIIELAWTAGAADEFGICKYEVLIVEMDAEGNTVAQYFEEVSLAKPQPAIDVVTNYSDDYSTVKVFAYPTVEGNMVVYSFSADISDGAEGEVPETGLELAWTPGNVDESGMTVYTIYLFEVAMEGEEMTVVSTKVVDDIRLAQPIEPLAGESADNAIALTEVWNNVAREGLGTDEAKATHFTYTADKAGLFTFVCNPGKIFNCTLPEVGFNPAAMGQAYGMYVEEGQTITFSAILPEVFYGEQPKLDENDEYVLDEEGNVVIEEVEVDITDYSIYAAVDADVLAPETDLTVALSTFPGLAPTTKADHWSGVETTYYGQASDSWGKSAWHNVGTKTVTLPAGKYTYRVAARASESVDAYVNIWVNGGLVGSAEIEKNGATGKGIDIDGYESDEEGTFANDGAGYGWKWYSVEFTLDEESEVTFKVGGQTEAVHQWMSFSDASLSHAPALLLTTNYNEDNSACVVTATPSDEASSLIISVNGGEDESWVELPAKGYQVAWLESLANEQGVCVYNVVVREVVYDAEYNMTVLGERTEQIHLTAPIPVLAINTEYNYELGTCVVTAEPTEEGTEMQISIDGGEEWMALPAEGYTIAWTSGQADEMGICVFNVVVREIKTTYDEELDMDVVETVIEGTEQISLNKAIELAAGNSAEEPIVLADGWNEAIAAAEIGTDEAGYTHFQYTAAEAGTFVFSCGYEIKAIEGLEAVETALARNAYGKDVEAGEVVEFSAYLPQSFEGVAYDEEGNEIEGETEMYDITEYTFFAGVDAGELAQNGTQENPYEITKEGITVTVADAAVDAEGYTYFFYTAAETAKVSFMFGGLTYETLNEDGEYVAAGFVMGGTKIEEGTTVQMRAKLGDKETVTVTATVTAIPADLVYTVDYAEDLSLATIIVTPNAAGAPAMLYTINGGEKEMAQGVLKLELTYNKELDIELNGIETGAVTYTIAVEQAQYNMGDPTVIEVTVKEGEFTAVDSVKSSLENSTIYNVAGQKVGKATKGMYIINGKKVLVK